MSDACGCFPHGPKSPCSCSGCWACIGRVVGCTCDIDWDCEHGFTRADGVILRAVECGLSVQPWQMGFVQRAFLDDRELPWGWNR